MRFIYLLILVGFFFPLAGIAQPVEQAVKLLVAPDHSDWQYKVGEPCKFSISVIENSMPLKNVKLNYQVGLEKMKPSKSGTLTLSDGSAVIDAGTLNAPGFLRCLVYAEVNGKQYKGLATAGYNITAIQPTVTKPADFDEFWNKGKADLAKVPMDVKMVLVPEKSSALSDVYHVNIQSIGNSRLYGTLSVPKKPGKYPAVLQVPGAGIRPYAPDLEMADRGLIVFAVGIHGIPVNMDISVYNSLEAGALRGYQYFNADHRDRYYYKRVYLNCIRANDFITSLPQYDGTNLAVSGNSQGGALSIVTASLDSRVKHLAAIHPALCDLTGYLNGRAGGWPHFFAENNLYFSNTKEIKETLPYFDVVNFARSVKANGLYTWGFNDEVCPPTSMYAAYNVIDAKKSTMLYLNTEHWIYPEQRARFNDWITEQLKSGVKK
jgi:cephalosporin-C deacetylase